jgi:hypothetical protein
MLHYVSCTLAVVLCAGPVLAAPPPTPITAVLLPDGRYSEMAIREMGHEAAKILKHSGVALRWHLGPSTQVMDGLLVVVELRGQCEMGGPSEAPKSSALGWSHEVDGKMLPFSDLACDNIRSAIQSPSLPQNHVQANILLGRAMGRVLAHELYHVVADTADHGENGVAQPALSARELTSGQLELRPPDEAAIQSGLRQAKR